jgi:protein tyrosine/serine phosphatase
MDLTSPKGRRRAWLDSLFDDHAALRTVWTNFHAVVPGVLYRSNHPTPGNLRRFVREKGIKTVINLRGEAGNGSDALSREAARLLDLDFIDLCATTGRCGARAWCIASRAPTGPASRPRFFC